MTPWFTDHRGAYLLVVGLVASSLAGLTALEVPNPLSEQLVAIRGDSLALLLGATVGPMAVRSNAATDLWVDSGPSRRLAWFVGLTVLFAALVVVVDNADGLGWGSLYRIGILWALPTLLSLLWGEATGLLTIFASFAAYVVTPHDRDAAWWSPLAINTAPSPLGIAGIVLVTVCAATYVSNLRGRRRF